LADAGRLAEHDELQRQSVASADSKHSQPQQPPQPGANNGIMLAIARWLGSRVVSVL